MFKTRRKPPDRQKLKLDFKLQFHATQVPSTGFDKLLVSVVSLESGKASARTAKSSVQNGNCRWPDSIIESARLVVHESKARSYEPKLYKLIVGTSSSFRSGVLGEATFNLAEYATATSSSATLALPLNNCSFATVLHIKIQCLTSTTEGENIRVVKGGEEEEEEEEDVAPAREEISDEEIDGSDLSGSITVGSAQQTVYTPPSVRDHRVRYSSDSSEASSTNSFSGIYDGISKKNILDSYSFKSLPSPARSARTTPSTRSSLSGLPTSESNSHRRNLSSSGMKMDDEVEMIRQQLNERVKDLFAKESEIDELKAEVEDIRTLHRESVEYSRNLVDEFEHEKLKASMQLTKVQEANAELIDAVRELETECERLEKQQQQQVGNSSQPSDQVVENLTKEIEELERDSKELTDENMELIFQLNKAKKELSAKDELIQELQEGSTLVKSFLNLKECAEQLKIENEELEGRLLKAGDEGERLRAEIKVYEREAGKLSEKERENQVLREKYDAVCRMVKSMEDEVESSRKQRSDLSRENDEMKSTAGSVSSQNENLQKRTEHLESEYSKVCMQLKKQGFELVERVQEISSKSAKIAAMESKISHMESEHSNLQENILELQQKDSANTSRIVELEIRLSTLKAELDSKQQLDSRICDLEMEKGYIEGLLQESEDEKRAVKERCDVLSRELGETRADVEIHLAEKASMENGANEMMSAKAKLEKEVAEVEGENWQLRERVAGLEAQLRYMTEERERLQREVQSLSERMSSTSDEKEKLISTALIEASQLRAEKAQWEENIRNLEENIRYLEENIRNLEANIRNLEENLALARVEFESREKQINEEVDVAKEEIKRLVEENEEIKKKKRMEVEVLRNALEGFEGKVKEWESTVEMQNIRNDGVEAENSKLKKLSNVMKQKVNEMEEEREEMKKKISLLEAEIVKKIKISPNGAVRSKSNAVKSPALELRDKLKALEGEMKAKVNEYEMFRRDAQDKQASLVKKIESLEMANDKLLYGHDSNLQQLQNEVERLQCQLSEYSQREQQLTAQLTSHQLLQKELQRLQEVNEEAETKMKRVMQASKLGNALERVVTLETELAEAVECNSMYKAQLRSAFATQENVHSAALENLGDVDKVVSDLLRYKRKAIELEEELSEIKERYLGMSLRFAQVEGEREQLFMTLKSLKKNGHRFSFFS